MRKTLSALALATWCGCALAQTYMVVDLVPTPVGFFPGHGPPGSSTAFYWNGSSVIVPPTFPGGCIDETQGGRQGADSADHRSVRTAIKTLRLNWPIKHESDCE